MDPSRYTILPIAPPPRTQALNTTTFCPPPLNGTLTLPEIWDWHAEHSPKHPLFGFTDDEGGGRTVYWPEAVRAFHRAGRHALSKLPKDASHSVVAILAACGALYVLWCPATVTDHTCAPDTITYFTMEAGIVRAGHVMFPISPRNSAPAVAHLLSKTNVAHVFVGAEPALQDLVQASLKLVGGCTLPTVSTVPTFEELYTNESFELLPPPRLNLEDPAVIMHSSGMSLPYFPVGVEI